jgi:hypothetical protein
VKVGDLVYIYSKPGKVRLGFGLIKSKETTSDGELIYKVISKLKCAYWFSNELGVLNEGR